MRNSATASTVELTKTRHCPHTGRQARVPFCRRRICLHSASRLVSPRIASDGNALTHCSTCKISNMMASSSTRCTSCGSKCAPVRAAVLGCSAAGPRPFSSEPILPSLTVRRRLRRCQEHVRRASKPKSSEHKPDNGTDERKASNSEAGTSSSDAHSSQKPNKTPNKSVQCLHRTTCSCDLHACACQKSCLMLCALLAAVLLSTFQRTSASLKVETQSRLVQRLLPVLALFLMFYLVHVLVHVCC